MEIKRNSFPAIPSDKTQQAKIHADSEQVQAQEAEAEEALSPAAMLQRFVDSTDEMSAAMAQFRNRRDLKKIDPGNDQFERVLDEDVLPKAQQVLKAAQSFGVPAELIAQLRSLFPDESDLLLVLRELLRRRRMDAISRQRLEEASAEVEAKAVPRRIKAGINCALKAKLFGKILQREASLLRESYRQFLEDTQTEAEIYAEWIGVYGYRHRAQIVHFMEDALASDVMSQDPSCSGTEFGGLLNKLTQLKMLRSADSLFVGNLLRYPLVRAHNDSEAAWVVFLLAILQAPEEIDSTLHETLGEAMVLTSHADRSTLLQLIYQACRSLPTDLFCGPDQVQALLERLEELAGIAHRREQIERRRGISDGTLDSTSDSNDGEAE